MVPGDNYCPARLHSLPNPFALAIDWLLYKATINLGINLYKKSKLPHLDYADDIIALSDSTQGLQGLVSATGKVPGGLGLSISDTKTKIMLSGNHQPSNDILISQNIVEVIKDFTCPGSAINN